MVRIRVERADRSATSSARNASACVPPTWLDFRNDPTTRHAPLPPRRAGRSCRAGGAVCTAALAEGLLSVASSAQAAGDDQRGACGDQEQCPDRHVGV